MAPGVYVVSQSVWVEPNGNFPVLESVIKEELQGIFQIEGITERSVTLMLYLMRKQVFLDGNKRVAMLSANQIMISHGKGIISVPKKNHQEFGKFLIEYYETGKMDKIKKYIYETSIDGIDLGRDVEKEAQDQVKKVEKKNNSPSR